MCLCVGSCRLVCVGVCRHVSDCVCACLYVLHVLLCTWLCVSACVCACGVEFMSDSMLHHCGAWAADAFHAVINAVDAVCVGPLDSMYSSPMLVSFTVVRCASMLSFIVVRCASLLSVCLHRCRVLIAVVTWVQ